MAVRSTLALCLCAFVWAGSARGQEPDSVVYFLEKPWKWTPEYVDMRDEQERPL